MRCVGVAQMVSMIEDRLELEASHAVPLIPPTWSATCGKAAHKVRVFAALRGCTVLQQRAMRVNTISEGGADVGSAGVAPNPRLSADFMQHSANR